MSPTTQLGIALLVTIAAGAAGYCWLHDSPAPAASSPTPTTSAEPEAAQPLGDDSAQATSISKASSPSTTQPAEPQATSTKPIDPDLPIDQRVAELELRANAGDLDATCDLLAALAKCNAAKFRSLVAIPVYIEGLADFNLPEQELKAKIERIAELQAQRQPFLDGCARVPPETRHSQLQDIYRLALAGNTSAMVQFADGDVEEMMANPDSYRLYRQHGFEMLKRAIEAGDQNAVNLWNTATFAHIPLAGLLPPEWNKPDVAHALQFRVQRELYGDDSSALDSPGSEEASAMFQRYFAEPLVMERNRRNEAAALEKNKQQIDRNDSPVQWLEDPDPTATNVDEDCGLSYF